MSLRVFRLLCDVVEARLDPGCTGPSLEWRVRAACTPWPEGLLRLAHAHLMTPALAVALEDLGLSDRLPDRVRAYIAAARALAVARNDRLREQLQAVALRLNEAGIAPTPLDGTLRLVDGLYPDPAWRFAPGLDLLIPMRQIAAAERALAAAGWAPAPRSPGSEPDRVALLHPEGEAPLELHATLLGAPHDRLLPAAPFLARAEPHALGGATLLLPTGEGQLAHLVAQAMLRHAAPLTGRFLLRDTVELLLLARRFGPAALAAVEERFVAAGYGMAWDTALTLARACQPRLAAGLPESGGGRHALVALLARRMMLQQGSPALMRALEPVGRLAARALGLAAASPAEAPGLGLAGMLGRLQRL